jgi:hypothetical protein
VQRRGHFDLERRAVETLVQRRAHGFDGRHNPVRAFAVAWLRDAFSAAAVGSVAELGHDHDSFGLLPRLMVKAPASGQRSIRTERSMPRSMPRSVRGTDVTAATAVAQGPSGVGRKRRSAAL